MNRVVFVGFGSAGFCRGVVLYWYNWGGGV